MSTDLVGNEPLVGTRTATAAALAIGGAVGSGTAGRVLFEDTGPVLADAAGFTYATTSGITLLTDDAATNTSLALLTLSHTSTGTAAASFGVGILFKAESAGGTLRSVGQIDSILTTATDAAEVTALVLKTMQAGSLVEVARIGGVAPAVDLSAGFGRCLLASPTTDVAHFSHRSMTSTTQYAVAQTAAGITQLNAASGQPLRMQIAGSTKWNVDSNGHFGQVTAGRQFQGLDANGVGAPNYSFITDTNTGIYNSSADVLGIAAGGVAQDLIGNATRGFFNTAPVVKQTSGANLTNSVTSGGTDDTIADFTSLTVYSSDAAAIRNDIYQLARKLKQINDGLRAYGLFT